MTDNKLRDLYRLVTVDDAPWGTYPYAPLVVIDGWSHSTSSTNGTATVCCRRWEGHEPVEDHPTLHGQVYPARSDEPRRRAYEAKVLAYFIRTHDIWGNPVKLPVPVTVADTNQGES